MSWKSFPISAVASAFRKEDVCHFYNQLIFKGHKIKALGTQLGVDIYVLVQIWSVHLKLISRFSQLTFLTSHMLVVPEWNVLT